MRTLYFRFRRIFGFMMLVNCLSDRLTTARNHLKSAVELRQVVHIE